MTRLVRTLGLWSVVAISMGAMLGSGIFVLPGMAAAIAGPSVWLAYVAAGVCVLPAALSTAELATAMPTSGGKYFFIDRTFGPLAGTISGIGLWLTLLLKSAFALVGFSAYFVVILDLPIKPTAIASLMLIVLLNVLGARKVGKALKWVVSLCVVGLGILVAAGVGHFEWTRLNDMFPNGASGFAEAMGLVFVSFAGVTKIAALAEEVKNPSRTLPLGILISLGLATAIYGGLVLALVATVPASDLNHDLHPVYLMAGRIGGPGVGIAAAVLAVLTMTSMANAGMLAASRFPFAMSRDHLVPQFFSKVHPRFRTPTRAIAISGVAVAAAILFVDVTAIAKLASSFLILIFIAVNCAVIVLRESDAQWYRPPFHAPLYPAFQIFGLLNGLFLLFLIGGLALLAAVGIALPGLILYVVFGRHRTSRRSVIRKIGDSHKPFFQANTETHFTQSTKSRSEETPSVAVVLFGLERSPETVVEIGMALSHKRKLGVVHINELPEQMFTTSVARDKLLVDSLRRRVGTMAQKRQVSVDFNATVTHDLVSAVRQTGESSGCDWVLMEWRRRGGHGYFLHSPLAWSLYPVKCNLALFKDAGIRYVQRILVYAEPGPNDALVADTCDHLARLWGADLTFVRFIPNEADDTSVQAQIDYIDELRHLCREKTAHCVVRGDDEVNALIDLSAGYDLLVMGEAREGFLRTLFFNNREKLTERTACSVLRLKTPRSQVHSEFKEERSHDGAKAADLLHFVSHRTIAVRLDVGTKEALFKKMADALSGALPGVSPQTVLKALWDREEMQNTSVGEGLALPHGTIDALEEPLVGAFTTDTAVAYGTSDGATVQVCFATLCPPSKRLIHLKLLAAIARLVQSTDIIDRQRGARTSQEAMSALEACVAEMNRGDRK